MFTVLVSSLQVLPGTANEYSGLAVAPAHLNGPSVYAQEVYWKSGYTHLSGSRSFFMPVVFFLQQITGYSG